MIKEINQNADSSNYVPEWEPKFVETVDVDRSGK
jgi:hypothetical protein